MKLDELKALEAHGDPDDLMDALHGLAPEILALMEAANKDATDPKREWDLPHATGKALAAFNAKLEAL